MMRNIHQICPSTSFIPPLGRDKARVFTLNLPNRLIFKAADEEGTLESADFLGKKQRSKNHGATTPENVAKLRATKIC
jgi:hypothetical protein